MVYCFCLSHHCGILYFHAAWTQYYYFWMSNGSIWMVGELYRSSHDFYLLDIRYCIIFVNFFRPDYVFLLADAVEAGRQ
ncbi:hypothetical protein MTR67_050607 [Solanum verrucosum]|uniref:Uncharacterized protein n=1 Tax=Solanum verrucosum TaxID=315347 RepID=A0AAF0V3A0_SOLVR|nr:hypothetical protein MTR67_050607 [Solanum verrucosum]